MIGPVIESVEASAIGFRPKRCLGSFLALALCFFGNPVLGVETSSAWLACEENADCTSIILGCSYWQPVNKKYISEMRAASYLGACSASFPPGPQPTSSCVNRKCGNDPDHPYAGKDWGRLGIFQRQQLISERLYLCTETAGIKIQGPAYPGFRDPYLRKVDNFIRHNPSTANKPLDQIIASQIFCKEVVIKAKAHQAQ